MSLYKEHPSQDENYFGLNSLDQAALINESNKIDVYFFNETDTPITISSNCVIGSINILESHAEFVDMNVGRRDGQDIGGFLPGIFLGNTPT